MVGALSWMRPSRLELGAIPKARVLCLKHESRSYCVKRNFAEKSSAKNLQLTLFVLLTVEAFPGAGGLLCGQRSC